MSQKGHSRLLGSLVQAWATVIAPAPKTCLMKLTSFISSELISLQGSSTSIHASLSELPRDLDYFSIIGYHLGVVYLNGDSGESKLNILSS